jgi:hypothetical protein
MRREAGALQRSAIRVKSVLLAEPEVTMSFVK